METGNRSGLNRMRTHTSRRMSANQRPHELYMRLTSLEIERARRVTERTATEGRLELINDRISEIEAERDLMQAKLAIMEQPHEPSFVPVSKMANKGHLQY